MADEMHSTTSQAISTVDPYEFLHTTRRLELPTAPPSINPSTTTTALSKDIPLNHQLGTWVRLYLPRFALNNPDHYNKLPVLVYFHGGGFVYLHVDSNINHDLCEQLAATAAALVVSVEYRLAPEHRLPAAYDDAIESLTWIKDQFAQHNEEWICRYADLSSCYLMGSSAGGNIVYHAGLRVVDGLSLEPLRIQGLILHAPFFGGMERTESEQRLANNTVLPLAVTDLLWELALPKGANRDHEYSNPLAGGGSGQGQLLRVKESGWKVLLTGCTGDLLIGWQMELVKVLEEKGIQVVTHITEGGYHGAEVREPENIALFFEVVKHFMLSGQKLVNHL